MKELPLLTNLKQHLDYDPITGQFHWIKSNKIAGKTIASGYIQIKFEQSCYYAHRLAWYYHTGEQCVNHIDHINGDKGDNRISNLRECSRSQNLHNQKRKGYYFHKRDKKWIASIRNENKLKHLGTFNTEEEARSAYIKAKNEVAGEFSPYATT